jgi:hypothetical protein
MAAEANERRRLPDVRSFFHTSMPRSERIAAQLVQLIEFR